MISEFEHLLAQMIERARYNGVPWEIIIGALEAEARSGREQEQREK